MFFSRRPGERFNRGRVSVASPVLGPDAVFGGDLVAWYEPQLDITQSTPGDGNPIETLGNVEGTASWDLTATSTARPTRVDGASPNGRRVARFNGSGNWMQATGVLVSQPCHVFIVAKGDTPAASLTNEYLMDGGSANTRVLQFYGTGSVYRVYAGAALDATLTDPDTWNRYEVLYNSTSSSLVRNGSTIASGNAGTAASAGFALASIAGGGFRWGGDVAFACIVGRAATATELDQIRAYMATR